MKQILTILLFAALCACATVPSQAISQSQSVPISEQTDAEILFLVKFADNSKFGEDEVLSVSLYDGSLMDAPMQPIAVFTDTTDSNYGPRAHIAGRFRYKSSDFEKLSIPSFSARLEKNGRLIAINTTSQPYSGATLAEAIIIDRVN